VTPYAPQGTGQGMVVTWAEEQKEQKDSTWDGGHTWGHAQQEAEDSS